MRLPQAGEGWRHYKGGYESLYEIVGTGHCAETGHAIVVYRLYRDGRASLWSRPLDIFLGYTDDHKRRFEFERAASSPIGADDQRSVP